VALRESTFCKVIINLSISTIKAENKPETSFSPSIATKKHAPHVSKFPKILGTKTPLYPLFHSAVFFVGRDYARLCVASDLLLKTNNYHIVFNTIVNEHNHVFPLALL
jgi:hypothetical protein